MRKNKYFDVFGEDFSSQSAAYKHFQSLKAEMLDEKLIGYQVGFFTEETPIKKSQVYKLLNDYGNLDYWKRHNVNNFVEDIEEFWLANVSDWPGQALYLRRTNKHDEENCPHCISFNKPNPDNKLRILCLTAMEGRPEDREVCNIKKAVTCFPGGSESSSKEKIQRAFRSEIEKQTKDFRTLNPDVCMECKQNAVGLDLQVDHKDPSFKELTKQFIKKHDYSEEYLKTQIDDHMGAELWRIVNEELACRWRVFHKEKASLQVLCVLCHAEKTKKERAV